MLPEEHKQGHWPNCSEDGPAIDGPQEASSVQPSEWQGGDSNSQPTDYDYAWTRGPLGSIDREMRQEAAFHLSIVPLSPG